MTDFEKFAKNRGWKFKTENELKAAYDRLWKHQHDILLSEDEFIAEAGENYEIDTLKSVYTELLKLVNSGKLRAAEIYNYARYCWCLRNPEAIVAYQTGRNEWIVNNCNTEATEHRAKIAVNSEWGFEASRIMIIGIPYYEATDYQFIRFDCADTSWLWNNGTLYSIYQ